MFLSTQPTVNAVHILNYLSKIKNNEYGHIFMVFCNKNNE